MATSSWFVKDRIVGNTSRLNEFSYFGVVATLVALLIAIFEVFHSVSVSKSIREEAKKLLQQARDVSGASFVSECLSILDEVNDHVSGERYVMALKSFQYFRKTYARISAAENIRMKIDDALGNVELSLQQATHTSGTAPLAKPKRREIQIHILDFKKHLEEMNPAKRGDYASY